MLPTRLFAAALALLATSVIAPAQAQNWPTRTVKLIVPFGPGAGADIGGRLFAEKLTQKWGHPVVIENRPGGDSIVAIQAFLSANDDHVLLFGPSGNFTVHPFNYAKLTYNPADLVPIARASNTLIAAAVKADGSNSVIRASHQEPKLANMGQIPRSRSIDRVDPNCQSRIREG